MDSTVNVGLMVKIHVGDSVNDLARSLGRSRVIEIDKRFPIDFA